MNRKCTAAWVSLTVALCMPYAETWASSADDAQLDALLNQAEPDKATDNIAPRTTDSKKSEPTATTVQNAPVVPDAGYSNVASPETTPSVETPNLDSISKSESAKAEVAAIPVPRRTKASPLEEIVVTAQRREENLQDVPISITVLNQAQISNANIANSADLAHYVPSLSVNTRFGPENASFTIRGFTQDLRTTASVGTYFADVIAPRGQSSQTSGDGAGPGSLWDLQNIQVLKGPQGTLFGRNTTGGAILLVPKKPTDSFEGYVEYSGGNFSAKHLQAVVNIPLIDDFKIRLGVDRNTHDGLLNNVLGVGADKLGNTNYIAGRFSAIWNITDSIENYSIISAVNSDTHGNTSRLFACNNPITQLTQLDSLGTPDIPALVNGLLAGKINATQPLPGVNTPSPFALLTYESCAQQLANQAATGKDGFYDVESAIKTPITQIKERRYINTTTWEVSEQLSFKNILSYSHLHTANGSNVWGTFFPDPTDLTGKRELPLGASLVSPDVPVTSQQTWVEEMQLQGKAFDDRFIWTSGLYYEHSTPDGFSGNNSASFLYCDLRTLEGSPSDYNCLDPFMGFLGGVLTYKIKTEYLNKAAYAQGTYNIFDAFSVTLGLRYTKDTTKGYGIKYLYKYLLAVQQAPTVTVQTPHVESSAPTGMLEFNYHPFDGFMTYAKYTRGYRQGSVNMLTDPGLDQWNPEHVNTYEIGAKTTFDGFVPGYINFAVFKNDLTDMQLQSGYISTTSGPTTAIFNAGKASSKGIEIESYFQPFDSLSVSLSYSHLNTKLIKSADFCSNIQTAAGFISGLTCTPIALVGDELPFAPGNSYVANLNWTLPVSEEFGQILFGTTYAYTGNQRAAASNSSPYSVLPGFGVLNLNLSWTEIFGKPYDFNVYATNILDTEYATYLSGSYKLLGIDSRGAGTPRMIGARLKYNF